MRLSFHYKHCFGLFAQVNSPVSDAVLGKAGLVVKNTNFTFNKQKALKVSKVRRLFFFPLIKIRFYVLMIRKTLNIVHYI